MQIYSVLASSNRAAKHNIPSSKCLSIFSLDLYFFNLRSECLTGALGGDADSPTTEVASILSPTKYKYTNTKYKYTNTKLRGDADRHTTEAKFKSN